MLHDFGADNSDGVEPNGYLILKDGVLYGTTSGGGIRTVVKPGLGTVFSYELF